MKLRRCFPPHQLLFLGLLVFTSLAVAQDQIVTKDGNTQNVKIVGFTGTAVQIQVDAGSVGVPLANISEIRMPAPAEYTAAVAAYEKGDLDAALTAAQAVVKRYKGLPTDWAREAMGMIGDIYAAQEKATEAEAAFKAYAAAYPGENSAQVDIAAARSLLLKKDFAGAIQKLEPVAEAALKEKQVAARTAAAYSSAFALLGQAKEGAGDLQGALQEYLRAVTIFPQDRSAVATAQQRADALRKEHGVAVP